MNLAMSLEEKPDFFSLMPFSPIYKEIESITAEYISICCRTCKKIREVHPEVCFWALNGGKPMQFKKRKRELSELMKENGFCRRSSPNVRK